MRKFKSYILLLAVMFTVTVACEDDNDPATVGPAGGGNTEGISGVYKGKTYISVGGNAADAMVQQIFVSPDSLNRNLVFRTKGLWVNNMELGDIVFRSNSVKRNKDKSISFTINQDADFQLETIEFISVVGQGVMDNEGLNMSYTMKPKFAPEVKVEMPSLRKIERMESDTIAIHALTFSDSYIVRQPVIDNELKEITVYVQDTILYKKYPCVLHVKDMTLSVGAYLETPFDSIQIIGPQKSFDVWAPDSINKVSYTLMVNYVADDEIAIGPWRVDSASGYQRCWYWNSSNDMLVRLRDSLGSANFNFSDFPVTGGSDTDSTADGGFLNVKTIQLTNGGETYNYPGMFFKGSWFKNEDGVFSLDSMNLGYGYNRRQPYFLHVDYSYSTGKSFYNDTIFSDKVVEGNVVADTIVTQRPMTDTCGVYAYLCRVEGGGDVITLNDLLNNDPRIVAVAALETSATNGKVSVDVPFKEVSSFVSGRQHKLIFIFSSSKNMGRTPIPDAKLFVENVRLGFYDFNPPKYD